MPNLELSTELLAPSPEILALRAQVAELQEQIDALTLDYYRHHHALPSENA